MSVTVTTRFSCGGCDAVREVASTVKVAWQWTFRTPGVDESAFGGHYIDAARPQDLVPTGWVWPDPYTGACYCPDCWRSIAGNEETDVECLGPEGTCGQSAPGHVPPCPLARVPDGEGVNDG
ncbi:MAG: hypothetical protein ACRDYZ_07935 [Acidimicrobiales bacterium]